METSLTYTELSICSSNFASVMGKKIEIIRHMKINIVMTFKFGNHAAIHTSLDTIIVLLSPACTEFYRLLGEGEMKA